MFGEGDPAGDLGDDGFPAGDEAGVLVEAGEGGEFDADVDHAAPVGRAQAAALAEVGRADRRRVQRIGGFKDGQADGCVFVVAGSEGSVGGGDRLGVVVGHRLHRRAWVPSAS